MHVLNRPLPCHAITVSARRSIEEIGGAAGRIEKAGPRSGLARAWLLAVLMVLAGVASTVSAAAQGISFAAPFTSYTQNVVVADQGIVADANSNIYISGTVNLVYLPLVNGVIDTSFDTNATRIDGGGSSAYGLAIDSGNNLYRVDDGTKSVNIYIFKGINDFNNGPFVSGNSVGIPIGPTWTLPSAVAVDADFNVYVLDAGPGSIVKLVPSCTPSPSCTPVYTASTVYTDPNLVNTTGMSRDSAGNFYFASGPKTTSNGINIGNQTAAVYKLSNTGTVASPSYAANSLVTLGSGWNSPSATAIDTLGNVWIADLNTSSIYELVPPGYTKGQPYATLTNLSRLTVSKAGQLFGLGQSGDAVVYVGGTAPHNLGAQSTLATSTTTVNFVTPATAVRYVVLSEGTNSGDFTDAGTGTCSVTAADYAAGSNCDVVVHFVPQAPGLRLGAVAFLNSAGTIISTNYLYGVGNMPEVAILPGKISTYAGTGTTCAGTGSMCGDGGAAGGALLNHPSATLVDEAGNLYIADRGSNSVRMVTTQGAISTVAGNGAACSSATAACGDGGLATAANLTPSGIALDGAGNLYIAVQDRIRMVNLATGVISTVAGTGAVCSNPTAACGDGGPAASAQLNLGAASGLAVDGAGNLLIADSGDNRIRSVALATGTISTVSGTGAACSSPGAACGDGAQATAAQFNNPTGIAVDASQDYLIVDTGDNRVRVISALTSSISTVAGDGAQCTSFADCGDGAAAKSAQLNAPMGVAADAAGNIYIADTGADVIRVVSVATSDISTVAGNAVPCATDTATCGDGMAATGASLNLPSGVALDNAGNLYIADSNDNRVRQVNVSSPIPLNFPNTIAGSTSSAQSVTVENIGNANLSFTAAGVAAPADYILGTGSTCAAGGTVAAGASCTLNIQFKPTKSGLLNESFTLTDNSLNVANASQLIPLNGASGSIPIATQEIASTTLTQSHAAAVFIPVMGSSGTGALTYSVSPVLPAGLMLDPNTGAITGTPMGTSPSASYTVTVTDSNGLTATASFTLTVNGAVVATQTAASTSLTENRAAVTFTPVTATGGTGALAYSVSPTLPSGLSINPATGAITGTPTGVSSSANYTVTVTDANGATATAVFNLAVNTPVSTNVAVSTETLTQGHTASFAPITATGGTGTLTYSVSPALPAGLMLNPSTGAITGTPTGVSSSANYTVTVTDANGATATAVFNLAVNTPVSTSVAVSTETLTQGHSASFTPVTATGGTGALMYSVSPALPAGLMLNPSTGAITGTPTGMSSSASYTVTATDSNGATATAAFSLTVNTSVSTSVAVGTETLTQGHSASFTPITAMGGTGALTYSVSPTLPAGLMLNPSTGAITGTPTGTSPSATYTVSVTDSNGATATAVFSLTVNTSITTTVAIASKTLTQNHAASFTPVMAMGGTGTLTYSVSPALPAGLILNASTGAITGMSSGTSSLTSYTVTVTDSNGATATASFNLRVDAAVVASQGVAATSLTENHVAMSFTPVTGAGGTGTLTYSVSPGLPAGLRLNPATGAITGTPTGNSSLTIYTVTVMDSNNAAAMATFSLTVNTSISTTVAVGSEMLTVNSAASFAPVTATGGTGAMVYSVSPGLPAGLSINPATGAITGTPTGTSALASYTVTATDANGSTAMASFSLQVQLIQPVVAINAPGASMTYGTALGIGATATYNGSDVAGSFSYTALPAGGVAHSVTAATVLPAGSYTLTASFTPANTTLYATATHTVLLTVNQATTAVSVSTSMNPSVLQNPITITAIVNAQATGSVSFMNGTTLLGSGAVSGGVATLITSSLPAGSQSIAAVYSGDSNFVAATSAASAQTVLDFGVNPGSASGSSSSSGSGMAQTVAPGQAATYVLAITPTAGTQFPVATVLSVSGLPARATASLSSPAWTQLSSISWSLPSNTPVGSVALTFQIPSETASTVKKDTPMHPLSRVFLGVLFLPFAATLRRRGRRLGRSFSLLLLLAAGTVGMTGLTGCGAEDGFFSQRQVTYNVTVTVTTGTLSHSTNLTLTVE